VFDQERFKGYFPLAGRLRGALGCLSPHAESTAPPR
jgi:hypothetical protein